MVTVHTTADITTDFTRADAVASLIVVALMLRAAWGLLRDSGRVLLEAAPQGIDLTDIRTSTDTRVTTKHNVRSTEAASTTTVMGAASPCPLDRLTYI